MIGRVLIMIVLLLFYALPLGAQEEYQPLEWGQISFEALNMTVYPADTSAQAVVLADEGYANVSTDNSGFYEYVLRRHRRVKILHEAAIAEQGDISIFYYHHDRSDQVRNIKAQAIAPDGTVSEVKSSDIYREKLNEYWSKVTFSFPNITVGSVLEYRYQLYSRRFSVPDEWTFRERIPVRSSYYQFTCDVPVVYTYLLRGTEYMKRETISEFAEILRMGNTEIQVDATRFWMKNGTAIIPEPFMTTEEDYFIKVRFQASEMINRSGTSKSFYGTWEETSRDLLALDDLGGAFTKNRNFKHLLEAANEQITPGSDQLETVYQISRFITEQIKWSGRRGIRTDITPDQAFERHEGDLPELQYAGIALLRSYGIDAHPVILSTREHGAMIEAFPFLDQFNYVIILSQVNGQYILLDFSDPLLKPGNVRIQALNNHGFLLHEEHPSWLNLSLAVEQDILAWNANITPQGAIEGNMKCTMSSYSARSERSGLKERSISEIWGARLPEETVLKNMEVQGLEDVRQPICITGEFEVPNAGFVNDDYLYLSPTLFSAFTTNPFTRAERDFPIDFPYPFEEKSVYHYTIPEGYEVESLPENVNTVMPGEEAIFQYMAQERSGKISILIVLRVKNTLYPPDQYAALRSIFETAADKLQEQIVLRRK